MPSHDPLNSFAVESGAKPPRQRPFAARRKPFALILLLASGALLALCFLFRAAIFDWLAVRGWVPVP